MLTDSDLLSLPSRPVRQIRTARDGIDLRAIILLSGSLRSAGFLSAIRRSRLDLPVARDLRVKDLWLNAIAGLARDCSLDDLRVRLLLGAGAHEPAEVGGGPVRLSIERDKAQLRGTGGIVRDAVIDYPDDSYVLIANAGQIVTEPLDQIVSEMAAADADVVVVSHQDATPSGLMLMRCACLRVLPEVGYVDLKEQGLRLIGQKYRIGLVHRSVPAALPIRTLGDYIRALQAYHRRLTGVVGADDPFAEDWKPSFRIIEDLLAVDQSARIHDSVILAGGVVEKGATVVRSVICPEAIVRRDALVVDQLA